MPTIGLLTINVSGKTTGRPPRHDAFSENSLPIGATETLSGLA
jgi:hypothetical protein